MVDVEAGHAGRAPVRARGQGGCDLCATRSMCVLESLDAQRRRALEPVIRKIAFHKGDRLIQEGTRALEVCVVKVGTVFGSRSGLDGMDRPVGLWGRGGVFGLCSFFGQRAQLTAVAVSPGRACTIPIDPLAAESNLNPLLGERIAATLVCGYGTVAAWSEAMRLPGVVNQLAYTMLLMAKIQRSSTIELPNQKSLAALLGTTRETIARAMATLEKAGVIRRHRDGMVLGLPRAGFGADHAIELAGQPAEHAAQLGDFMVGGRARRFDLADPDGRRGGTQGGRPREVLPVLQVPAGFRAGTRVTPRLPRARGQARRDQRHPAGDGQRLQPADEQQRQRTGRSQAGRHRHASCIACGSPTTLIHVICYRRR